MQQTELIPGEALRAVLNTYTPTGAFRSEAREALPHQQSRISALQTSHALPPL